MNPTDLDLRHDPVPCPNCGYKFDTASNLTGKVSPKPGDFTLCFNCGVLLRFDAQRRPRALTLDDVAELAADPKLAQEIARMQAGVRAFHHQRVRRN